MGKGPKLALLPRGFRPVLTAESSQCVIRIVAGLVGAAYMFVVVGRVEITPQTLPWLLPAMAYALFGYAWIWVTHYSLGSLNGRVLVSLSVDHGLIATYLHFAGAPALVWAWGMPFANVGHGLRFGPHYASIGAAIGTFACAVAFGTSPYWRSVPYTAVGLILLNSALPLYVTKLANTIWRERGECRRRADEMTIAARTDFLTSALNRAGFEHALNEALTTSAGREPFAVMLLDLDGFKAINDAAGHAAGDAVLRDVARAIRSQVRRQDILARLGGDEFGLVVRGIADGSRAEALAGAIRKAIAQIAVDGCREVHPGASIGYKLVGIDAGVTVAEVIAAADEMMYAAKRGALRLGSADTARR